MHRILFFILLTFIVGCSWASQMSYKGRAYLGLAEGTLVSNDVSSLKDAGIVIGRVIRENVTGGFSDYIDRKVIFRNLATGEEFSYFDGDYFFLRLVEGQYAIVGFETKMGIPLRAENDGFKFRIRNGEVTYIGSIVGDGGLKRSQHLVQGNSSKTFFSGRYDGGASLFIPNVNAAYNFYVINDKERSVTQFKSLFSNLKDVEVKTDLMN